MEDKRSVYVCKNMEEYFRLVEQQVAIHGSITPWVDSSSLKCGFESPSIKFGAGVNLIRSFCFKPPLNIKPIDGWYHQTYDSVDDLLQARRNETDISIYKLSLYNAKQRGVRKYNQLKL